MKTFRTFVVIIAVILFLAISVALSYLKWRAEHPAAELWTFFI